MDFPKLAEIGQNLFVSALISLFSTTLFCLFKIFKYDRRRDTTKTESVSKILV